jgi:fatty acid desaturase
MPSPRASSALDDAIRPIPIAWFTPDRRIYWTDMVVSALAGWTALGASLAVTGWLRAALMLVAVVALYRAVLFIHEITHLAVRDVPGFRAAWNALVGVPLLLPSFLYEGIHTDHHRPQLYGTVRDPEYVPFGRRSPFLLVSYVTVSAIVPLGLIVRFGVLAPLSWMLAPLRRVVVARMSALVINHQYTRHAPLASGAIVQEAAAAGFVWAAGMLWAVGVLPSAAIAMWLVVAAIASTINAIRTLAAHRYDHEFDDTELSRVEQLLDTCTIAPARGLVGFVNAAWRELWAPVGLRYHALHHWVPSLPYHNLGRAHRLLSSTLAADSAYAETSERAIGTAIVGLAQRAAGRTWPAVGRAWPGRDTPRP